MSRMGWEGDAVGAEARAWQARPPGGHKEWAGEGGS